MVSCNLSSYSLKKIQALTGFELVPQTCASKILVSQRIFITVAIFFIISFNLFQVSSKLLGSFLPILACNQIAVESKEMCSWLAC